MPRSYPDPESADPEEQPPLENDPPRVEAASGEPAPPPEITPGGEGELPPAFRLWRVPGESPGVVRPERGPWYARLPGWAIYLTILLGGLLAHGLCVASVFYLDDWNQVVANDWVDHDLWYEAGTHALTYFTYWLTYLIAGISAPAFHVGNLLLHLAAALVLAGFARRLLEESADLPPERSRRIAWLGSLFFAVHPLCSEVPNYVRARDIELATLCSLLAAWAALRWRRQRRFKLIWPSLTLLAVLAATVCKEVGYILGMGSALLVGFGVPRVPGALGYRTPALVLPVPTGAVTPVKTKLVATPKDAAVLLGHWPVKLSLALVGLCIALLAWPAWITAVHAVNHPLFGWHVLTKARVFWMGMGRVLVPIGLCSDHQIAWTRSWRDYPAWVALAAEAGVVVWTIVLFFRARTVASKTVGILLALVLLALLHRLANPGADLMVEYRMYPAMAPLCVLLAWGLDRLLGLIRSPQTRQAAAWSTITLLVLGCVMLSARRALIWNSTESLVNNVLAQYPLQNRARKELQDNDVRAGRWISVLQRQPDMRRAVGLIRDMNAASPVRNYDTAALVTTHIATEGNCALALAKLGRLRDAFNQLQWTLESLPPGSGSNLAYKAALYYARGRVEEVAGHQDLAIEYFRQSQGMFGRPETERALRRARIIRSNH